MIAERLKGRETRDGQARCLVKGEASGSGINGVRSRTGEFGKGSQPPNAGQRDRRHAWRELRYPLPGLNDLARAFDAKNLRELASREEQALPSRTFQSTGLILAACTFTITSGGPGTGSGTSSMPAMLLSPSRWMTRAFLIASGGIFGAGAIV